MRIGEMNVKIKIQKQTTAVDSVGNHINTWTDWHICRAAVSGEAYHAKEAENIKFVQDTTESRFHVRWCSATKDIDPLHYRLVHNGNIYNIIDVDHLRYTRKELVLKCIMDVNYV